jgi:signal transduction histidine kinase
MEKGKKSEATNLRQKAEELLKKKPSKKISLPSEAEMYKLIHELEVHQMELQVQNEELIMANKKAEAAVRNYTELFKFTPACYYKLSAEGEIIDLNLSGAHMLGKTINYLKKSRFGFFVSDDTKPVFNIFLRKVFDTQTKQSCELNLSIDDHVEIYVYLIGLITKNGKYCHINLVDITERKVAEVKLKKVLNDLTIANKEIVFQNEEKERRAEELIVTNKELKNLNQLNADKNLFISILAHDLRSPFSALLGLLELLSESVRQLTIDEIESLVNQINEATQNTFTLLEDLLKWARMQSGKIPFEPQIISFTDICQSILEFHAPNANAKNIIINYFTAKEINVYADIDMLKAVLRNLVSNAIKFTNKNGLINISAELTHPNITISVMDNGIGIEPENLLRLFNLSQVLTTKGTEQETGTGLGLLLCKEFVEKHGGKIWAESKYGIGSEFKFTLPAFTGPLVC